jgi:hypothetical protein
MVMLLIKKRILQAEKERLKISSIKGGLPAAKNSMTFYDIGFSIKIPQAIPFFLCI